MPRKPPPTLVQALLGTAVGEDALTDGLAYLLARDADLVTRFASLLELPDGAWHCRDCQTQVRIAGGRVDLELILETGSVTHLVWVEAKTHTTDHDEQLATYQAAKRGRQLEVGADHAEVVTLAPFGNRIELVARDMGLQHLTWQRILAEIVLSAESQYETGWRERAVGEDAPARLRDLLDYTWRLEDRGVAVNVEPLRVSDEEVAARAEALLNPQGVVGELLDAATRLDGFERGDSYSYPAGRVALSVGCALRPIVERGSWHLASPRPSVPAAVHAWFSTTDARFCAALERPRPGFLLGMVFGFDDGTPLPATAREALTDPTWESDLPDGVYVGRPDYGQIWLVGVQSLSELTTVSTDLAGQKHGMREWAAKTIDAVFRAERPAAWPADEV